MIRIPETSHETYALLVKFGTEMGKTTVESKVHFKISILAVYVYLEMNWSFSCSVYQPEVQW